MRPQRSPLALCFLQRTKLHVSCTQVQLCSAHHNTTLLSLLPISWTIGQTPMRHERIRNTGLFRSEALKPPKPREFNRDRSTCWWPGAEDLYEASLPPLSAREDAPADDSGQTICALITGRARWCDTDRQLEKGRTTFPLIVRPPGLSRRHQCVC